MKERSETIRRKKMRRMYDQMYGKVTEEERRAYDETLYSLKGITDRRAKDRRSGEDRRGDG